MVAVTAVGRATTDLALVSHDQTNCARSDRHWRRRSTRVASLILALALACPALADCAELGHNPGAVPAIGIGDRGGGG